MNKKTRLVEVAGEACRSASETLSAEAQEEYVKSGGFRCPYCGSTDIAGTGLSDSDADWHSKEIECEDCGKMWDDIYTLSSISDK